MRTHRGSRRHQQQGLTLVELLVGLTLGLLISAALLLLFANASANGQNLARSGSQIENGRYVTELLREDFRLAGFYGETSVTSATYSTPDPCETEPTGWDVSPFTVPAPVQGFGPDDDLDCLDNRKAGTDAIVIRRLGIDAVDTTTLPAGNKQYYTQYSFCNDDAASPGMVFEKDPALFVMRSRTCGTSRSPARAYVSRTYYIASCNRCDAGDNIPTLKRVELIGDELVTTALAEGVETLRLEFGFDTTPAGDGSADVYLPEVDASDPADPTASWANVMTVKTHLIIRSLEKAVGSGLATAQEFELGDAESVSTAADGYTRRAYSSVIRLVNPSSVREKQ